MGNGMDKVLEGLYVGSLRDSTDRKQLDENKITHILSIFNNPRPTVSDKVYLCITAQDNQDQDLGEYFPECNDFIHQARVNGGHVLVHCLAGVSRSVSLVIAYVMSVTTHSWRSSFNIVHAAHPASSPNFNFQRQLLRFQYEQLPAERERLKKKWPPSPHDDTAACEKWLAAHEKWVLEGSNSVHEDEIYPLPYDPLKVRATVSEPLARRDDTSGDRNRTVEPCVDSSRDQKHSTTPDVSSGATTNDASGTSFRRKCEETLDPIDKALLDDLFDN